MRYVALDFCLVRVPLLPIEGYLRLGTSSSPRAPSSVGTTPSPPEESDLLPADPRVDAALAAASPSLLTALRRGDATSRDRARARGKLLRYQIRMSTRATPFGLFAGVALGQWADQTDLAVATTLFRTKTRIDTGWLLDQALTEEEVLAIRTRLRFVANTAAFVRGGRLFLTDPGRGSQGGPDVVVSVRATPVVLHALSMARGPIDHDALLASIAQQSGGGTEQAQRLITSLWSQGFLITDLRPPMTGLDPAAHFAARVANIPAASRVGRRVESAVADCAKCDVAVRERRFTDLKDHLLAAGGAELGGAPQIDLAVQLQGSSINREVGREAVRLAETLLSISPYPHGSQDLASYRAEFQARYGHGRTVPVAELLDPDYGLGPPRPGGAATTVPSASVSRRELLLQLAVEAVRDRRRVLELDAGDLSRLQAGALEHQMVPPSLELYVLVAARSAAAVDAGQFSIVVGPNVGTSAAGRTLGRFAGLLGPPGLAALQEAARREEAVGPKGIWAELCYLPRISRSANVVIRPPIRSHEIVIGVSAGVDGDHVVPLDELVIGVRDERFFLHWPQRGVDIVAVSGHMLNTARASHVCRFLSHLAHDGQAQLSGFDWGGASSLPFLPRVQSGRMVLAPAQWQIDGANIRERLQVHEPSRFRSRLAGWREAWQVPRHVHIGSADRRLVIDLDDDAQVEQFRLDLRSVRDGERFVVREVLPAFDELWVQGAEGRYVCELVVPMVLRTPASSAGVLDAGEPARSRRPDFLTTQAADRSVSRNERLAAPGSDWLYVKLYGPRFLEDDLIAGPLRTFASEVCGLQLAESWFFLRYSDPDSHVRARFHGDQAVLTGSLLPKLCAWGNELLKEGRCTRVVIDTYDREVERFGGVEGVAAAEALFAADTTMVVELLHLERTGQLGIDRICLSVMVIDTLLAGLGMDERARIKWCKERTAFNRVTGNEYRQRRAELLSLLKCVESSHTQATPGSPEALLMAYHDAVTVVAGRLEELADGHRLAQPVWVLAQSFVHLLCNRLLGVQRVDEMRAIALLFRAKEARRHIDASVQVSPAVLELSHPAGR